MAKVRPSNLFLKKIALGPVPLLGKETLSVHLNKICTYFFSISIENTKKTSALQKS